MCMETRSQTVRPRWRYLLLRRFKIQRVESKRVDAFENMTDEELRQYVYGNKELDA